VQYNIDISAQISKQHRAKISAEVFRFGTEQRPVHTGLHGSFGARILPIGDQKIKKIGHFNVPTKDFLHLQIRP